MEKRLSEIARLIGGAVEGDSETPITGVAGIKDAGPGDITFLANPKYLPLLPKTRASAVIVDRDAPACDRNLVRTEHPYLAFTQVLKLFSVELPMPKGIHPASVIGRDVALGEDVALHAGVVVEEGCSIGPRSVLYAGVCVGRGSRIGADCTIYPRVVICGDAFIGDNVIIHIGAIIGARDEPAQRAGLQDSAGKKAVVIENDVEVGANVTVEAGRSGVTVIGAGTKIDNLVHIGSDASVGRNCIIVSHSSVGSGCNVGECVTIAGQASVLDGITVGDGAVIAARAGVDRDIRPYQVVSGFPISDHEKWLRIYASLNRLPGLVREFRELEKRVRGMEQPPNAKTEDD